MLRLRLRLSRSIQFVAVRGGSVLFYGVSVLVGEAEIWTPKLSDDAILCMNDSEGIPKGFPMDWAVYFLLACRTISRYYHTIDGLEASPGKALSTYTCENQANGRPLAELCS